ncbi:hypothetical protein VP01_2087g2 [Puccinia sorghi]|uniref:Uncharacterized protein n=1 Tax=Puccinia sorghi TaxID=27349 RepID=A0A0L6VAF3_9BASI|nr:hypothetical protein VP01_2087g2 [Puccinia sorghi]
MNLKKGKFVSLTSNKLNPCVSNYCKCAVSKNILEEFFWGKKNFTIKFCALKSVGKRFIIIKYCFHITFLNNLLVTPAISKINLMYFPSQAVIIHPILVRSSFDLLNKSYISFAHPIFFEIIFKFQKTVKDHKENEVIHAQGLMFFLEIIINHISYGHHFMTLIFIFYVMITLRIHHSASTGSINPDNPKYYRSLTKPTQLSQKINICSISSISTNLTVRFMILRQAFKDIKIFSTPTDTLPQAKATVSIFCLCVFACNHNVWPYVMVKRQTYIPQHNGQYRIMRGWLFLTCWRFLYDFNMTSSQRISTKLRTKSTKNQAKHLHNLQPTHNRYQHTTINSLYDQFNRKHFHESSMKTSLLLGQLPSKLHMFAYVDVLAQSLCGMHSDCASKLGRINFGERLE